MNDKLIEFIDSYKIIFGAIFLCSFVFVMYKIMHNQKSFFNDMFNNFALAILVIILLPTVMMRINDITQAGIKTTGTIGETLIGDSIIQANIIDLLKYDDKNFELSRIDEVKMVSLESIRYIDINEGIENSSISEENKVLFQKKIANGKNDEQVLTNMGKSWWGFGPTQKYYRYTFNFVPVMITLIILSFTFIIVAFKIGRIIFEQGIYRFLSAMIALAIDTSQRLRTIIQSILGAYLTLFFMSAILKIYTIFMTQFASNNRIGNPVQEIVVNLILIAAGSMSVITFPLLLERVLGVDTGFRQENRLIKSMSHATRNVNKTVNKTFKKIFKNKGGNDLI